MLRRSLLPGSPTSRPVVRKPGTGRAELAKHAQALELVPTGESYMFAGEWNLLGDSELVAGDRNERKVTLPFRLRVSDAAA